MYALVENGNIVAGPCSLPPSWRNISNLPGLSDNELRVHGWLPVRDEYAALDQDQEHGEPVIEVVGDEVVRMFHAVQTPVPQSITRAQARAVLILDGLIGSVQSAIDAIVDPVQRELVQNDWDHRLHFERDNQTLIALAAALGLDDEALDSLFVRASQQ